MLEKLLPGLTYAPNAHPMFVHFPIALWVVAGLFLFLGMVRQREDLFIAGRWLLSLGAIGAAAAVGTGLWAADAIGHDSPGHELVHVHRDLMLAATGLGLGATILAVALRNTQQALVKWGITAVVLVTVGVLTLGADRGAALVFRHGVGVETQNRPAGDHANDDGHHGRSMAPGGSPNHSHDLR